MLKFELEWRIGKYPILQEIGRGATSRVYLARDPFAERDVAVKVFFYDENLNEQSAKLLRKGFLAEQALAGRLIHPHIVEIHDAVSEPEYSYIVMEHVPGTTLETYCEIDNLLPQSQDFYLRYYMGGETQIRGYNIRSVGPRDRNNNILGGNKFLLFNAEYYIDIAGPLRFLFFFDAGQAYLENQSFDLSELRTSTGVELRFIMPVLNVPFRLIYAWNPHRDPFQPASAFKFAVGTTF